VREIILQNTKENFDMVLAEKSVAWDQKFLAYFNNNILTDIDSIAKYKIIAHVGHYFNLKSGKYTVFSVNDHSASYLTCYSETKGMQTNGGEGLNNLFGLIMDNKRRPVDILAFSLYRFSVYYSNEILLGYTGTGQYKLKEKYLDMRLHHSHVNLREQFTFKQIVETWQLEEKQQLAQLSAHNSIESDVSDNLSDISAHSLTHLSIKYYLIKNTFYLA